MLKYVPCLFLLVAFNLSAQKVMEQSQSARGIHKIVIQGKGVYRINVKAEDRPDILMRSEVEGEGYENVLLRAINKNGMLSLGYEFTPYFRPENDKLAAHKVLSVELELLIPEKLTVAIASSLASVDGSGTFTELNIELAEGYINLNGFSGNGKFKTITGDISVVATAKETSGEARSKEGKVTNQLSALQPFQITAQSVKGDIRLLKSQ